MDIKTTYYLSMNDFYLCESAPLQLGETNCLFPKLKTVSPARDETWKMKHRWHLARAELERIKPDSSELDQTRQEQSRPEQPIPALSSRTVALSRATSQPCYLLIKL